MFKLFDAVLNSRVRAPVFQEVLMDVQMIRLLDFEEGGKISKKLNANVKEMTLWFSVGAKIIYMFF